MNKTILFQAALALLWAAYICKPLNFRYTGVIRHRTDLSRVLGFLASVVTLSIVILFIFFGESK